MQIAILSCGAVVVKEKQQSWLFGAPEDVQTHLDNAGIETPQVLFTTSLRSPGSNKLNKPVMRFKELPLTIDTLSAKPLQRKHGTDYVITSGNNKVLFSERGDVSIDDVAGYDLAIIKNKQRSDKFDSSVITWPWPDAEIEINDASVEIREKVWTSMSDVPDNIKELDGAKLTLDQTNYIAKIAQAAGQGGKEAWGIAISQFKKSYVKSGNGWKEKPKTTEKDMGEDMSCCDKLSQDKAGYVKAPANAGVKICANCEYYCQDMTCLKVEGDINPINVCVFWEYGLDDDNYEEEPESTAEEAMSDEESMPDEEMDGNESSTFLLPPDYSLDDGSFAYMGEILKESSSLRTSDGRLASDHLVVEDPEKVSTWHLPVSKDGKLDHRLMGAAEAALTVGFHKNKYEGPNKDEAIKKLVKFYKDEKLEVPANLETVYESLKEYVEGRPIPKIIDILTANLHKAYNDTSDNLFKLGYLSQDERMKIAASIGTGLNAFRDAISKEEFANRAVDKYDVESPVFKDLTSTTSVFKSADDSWRWVTITSVATYDKQGELLSTKAMDWAIAFNKFLGTNGPLRYKHIPGVDGGVCDTQVRIGDFLFESGTFSDNPVGLAMRNKLKSDPEGWQISPGLAFAKGDLVNGVYQRAAIFERSMTQRPANPWTIIVSKKEDTGDTTMKVMTEAELQQAAKELNLGYEELKAMYEKALVNGSGPMELKEFKEVVMKATGTNATGFPGGANAVNHTNDEEEEKKALKEAISDLTEAELKELKALVIEAEKACKPKKATSEEPVDEEMKQAEEPEDMMAEDEVAAEVPAKKKKVATKSEDDRISALEDALKEQQSLILEQTKAMTNLAVALASGGAKQSTDTALADILANIPRRQAGGFATDTRTKQQMPIDEAILTKLDALEKQFKEQSGKMPTNDTLYDMFTSQKLNQKGGVR